MKTATKTTPKTLFDTQEPPLTPTLSLFYMGDKYKLMPH
ncbi:hypothetical protein HBZC1_p0690 (plasmid) [Helicobacter bizzozeronii CIII-1]|uniref:Uncharacterized protein n=1 Tax=Helicobacter bizzozeronii (strain CIII-1) TaxID=1002804 RepID=F8KUL4_HELBC|nr:hypothetical protein HBZC1_p0690 [Helicobacter bizzozeronii CIII-1]